MNRIITFFVCLGLFYCTFTPIKAFYQGGQAISLLIPSLLIFIFDQVYSKRVMIWLSMVLTVVALMGISGVAYFENWVGYCVLLFFSVMGLEHYMIKRDITYAKHVLFSYYGIILLLVVISIPQFILVPGLSRLLLEANEDPSIELNYFWSISYQTIHAIPLLVIPLFAVYSRISGFWKKLFVLLCISSFVVVMFLADAATSLIMMVLILVFFLVYNGKLSMQKNFVRLFALGILILPFLSKTGLAMILKAIQPIFEGTSGFNKVDELILLTQSGQTSGDIEGREELYSLTLNTIANNPLLPNTEIGTIGGHSFMLDHIAVMGVLLFIPYIFLVIDRYKRPLKIIGELKIYHLVCFASMIFLAAVKNFFIIECGFFIVPLFLIFLRAQTTQKIINFKNRHPKEVTKI